VVKIYFHNKKRIIKKKKTRPFNFWFIFFYICFISRRFKWKSNYI